MYFIVVSLGSLDPLESWRVNEFDSNLVCVLGSIIIFAAIFTNTLSLFYFFYINVSLNMIHLHFYSDSY